MSFAKTPLVEKQSENIEVMYLDDTNGGTALRDNQFHLQSNIGEFLTLLDMDYANGIPSDLIRSIFYILDGKSLAYCGAVSD